MDGNTAMVIVLVVLVLLAGAGFFFFRQSSRVKIKGPFGTGMEYEGSNVPPAPVPAIRGEGIQSRKGGLNVESETGAIELKEVEVERDVDIKTREQHKDPDPKV